ncbi:hypothetical protein AAY473_035495 [Plecturocebus cupreus]
MAEALGLRIQRQAPVRVSAPPYDENLDPDGWVLQASLERTQMESSCQTLTGRSRGSPELLAAVVPCGLLINVTWAIHLVPGPGTMAMNKADVAPAPLLGGIDLGIRMGGQKWGFAMLARLVSNS